MVNRSKISKEISRAAGGGAGRNVRKGTNVRRINVPKGETRGNVNRPGDWIPNPKYRAGDLYSGEPPMIRNPERKKDKARAKVSAEKEKEQLRITQKRKQERDAKKIESRKAPQKVTTVKRPDPPEAATTVPRISKPKRTTKTGTGRKEGERWHTLSAIKSKDDAMKKLREAAGKRGKLQSKKQRIAFDMQRKKRPPLAPPRPRDLYKAVRQNTPLEEEMRETVSDTPTWGKAGGKVSKSKGGTVKKMHGGKLHTKTTHKKKNKKSYDNHHGGKLVASLYD